jgi:hypothetical protein
MSWERTLNKQGTKFFNFTKMVIKNVNMLHECKKSKDANRLLRVSMMGEFVNDENENSIRNPLIEKIYKTQLKKRLRKLHFKFTPHNTNKNLYN